MWPTGNDAAYAYNKTTVLQSQVAFGLFVSSSPFFFQRPSMLNNGEVQVLYLLTSVLSRQIWTSLDEEGLPESFSLAKSLTPRGL